VGARSDLDDARQDGAHHCLAARRAGARPGSGICRGSKRPCRRRATRPSGCGRFLTRSSRVPSTGRLGRRPATSRADRRARRARRLAAGHGTHGAGRQPGCPGRSATAARRRRTRPIPLAEPRRIYSCPYRVDNANAVLIRDLEPRDRTGRDARLFQSVGLMPETWIRTRTSPGPGSGRSTSSIRIMSPAGPGRCGDTRVLGHKPAEVGQAVSADGWRKRIRAQPKGQAHCLLHLALGPSGPARCASHDCKLACQAVPLSSRQHVPAFLGSQLASDHWMHLRHVTHLLSACTRSGSRRAWRNRACAPHLPAGVTAPGAPAGLRAITVTSTRIPAARLLPTVVRTGCTGLGNCFA
jgi:hypothetical protein